MRAKMRRGNNGHISAYEKMTAEIQARTIKPFPQVGEMVTIKKVLQKVVEVYKHHFVTLNAAGRKESFIRSDNYEIVNKV